jgi:hypothetical protein
VEVTIGEATVVLSDVSAHVEGEATGAPCRLGIDVLGARGGAVFDFGAGRFTLEAE